MEERKIRVVFLPAENAATTPHKQVNGTVRLLRKVDNCPLLMFDQHLGDDAPPAYGSPTPSYGSPSAEAVTPNLRSYTQPDSQATNQNRGLMDTPNHVSTSTSVSGAVANVANAVPITTEELQNQLAQAKAQIAKLTSSSNDQGARQRKPDAVAPRRSGAHYDWNHRYGRSAAAC